MADENAENLILLGKISGQLESIQQQINANFESTNKRFDDFTTAINRRIDDHQRSNRERFNGLEDRLDTAESQINSSNKKNMLLSGGSSATVIALVEVIKQLIGK